MMTHDQARKTHDSSVIVHLSLFFRFDSIDDCDRLRLEGLAMIES